MHKIPIFPACLAALMIYFPLSTHCTFGAAAATPDYNTLEQQYQATQQAIIKNQTALSKFMQVAQERQAQVQCVILENEFYMDMLHASKQSKAAQQAIAEEAMVLAIQWAQDQKNQKQLSQAQFSLLVNELNNEFYKIQLQVQKQPQVTQQAIKQREAILEKLQQLEDQQDQYISHVSDLYLNAIYAENHELDVLEAQEQSCQIQQTQAIEQADAEGPI
ncbi:MAG TPA: hypothetical protein VKJ65_08270 [Phycisphaerae bacterium]|nr:hypothetical protein [Phycisphaerae bacterium]